MEDTYIFTSNGELCHWGIKGMKWGVRKDRKKSRVSIPIGKKRRQIFKSVTDMMKIKNVDDIADWSEKEDAKIRDDLNYGKITKQEAERRWDKLAETTDYMYKRARGQQVVENSWLMQQSTMQSIQFANDQAMRASVNASLQSMSLAQTGGTNPFMFGSV